MYSDVRAGSLSCWADAYRGGADITLLSLFGTTNIVRSMVSKLSGGDHVSVSGHTSFVRLNKHRSYAKLYTSLPGDIAHAVVVDRVATSTASSWDTSLVQTASSEDEAKKLWIKRFSRRCRVPVKLDWGPALWDAGIAAKLVTPLRGFGVGCWEITLTNDGWHTLISQSVREGKLSG